MKTIDEMKNEIAIKEAETQVAEDEILVLAKYCKTVEHLHPIIVKRRWPSKKIISRTCPLCDSKLTMDNIKVATNHYYSYQCTSCDYTYVKYYWTPSGDC